jgi:hypothetical protein
MIKSMKYLNCSLLLILSMLLISGCTGKGSAKKEAQTGNDTVSVPDTGFTGIKQFMSGKSVVMEVTFKNGVREGLMKTFYTDGRLRQTFWYKNGLREDSSRWYFPEGQLFRTTPYKKDTIDGVQMQYYRNGKLKARLGYIKGLRTPFLEEYTMEGKLITGYPELIVSTRDEYQSKGIYRISLKLSDRNTKVRFYRGDIKDGVIDTARYETIRIINGTGNLDLKKTGAPKAGYIGVIAEILTNFGNNLVVYKKIDLPYKDLN